MNNFLKIEAFYNILDYTFIITFLLINYVSEQKDSTKKPFSIKQLYILLV